MEGSKKQKLVDNGDHESSESEYDDDDGFEDDEEEDDEDQMLVNTTVDVEFEARNAEDSDFHGIRKLLQQLFLKANIDLSQITNTIISQNYVGSVIKQVVPPEDDDSDEDDDDNVFGVISVLNMSARKEEESMKQLRSMLLDRCAKCSETRGGGKASRDALAAVLDNPDHQVALLINERFINIPPQIALPSFEALWKEVERAAQKKMRYNFTHILMICKTYGTKSDSGDKAVTFVNAEEALFKEAASSWCEYSVSSERDTGVGGQWDEEEEMEPGRMVLVVPYSALPSIMTQMKDMLT